MCIKAAFSFYPPRIETRTTPRVTPPHHTPSRRVASPRPARFHTKFYIRQEVALCNRRARSCRLCSHRRLEVISPRHNACDSLECIKTRRQLSVFMLTELYTIFNANVEARKLSRYTWMYLLTLFLRVYYAVP